jgi:transposase InsO family protein
VPLSHPFVERLIGTIRRELLDLLPYWTAQDLERKLSAFQEYYNGARVHRALDGVTPDSGSATGTQTIARLQDYRWQSHCRGLYQLPIAA